MRGSNLSWDKPGRGSKQDVLSLLQGQRHSSQGRHAAVLGMSLKKSYFTWLKFGISNRLKRNWNSTQFMLWFWRLLNHYNSLVRRQSSSLSPSLSPSLSSGNLSEGCSRRLSKVFRAKSTAKLLGPLSCSPCAGRTGEHKHGRFQVGFSHCRQRPARLRKICYHSCDTDSVQESTRFWCFVDIWQRYKFWATTSHFFFHVKWKFWWKWREVVANWTKAAPIASLNLSISHWSLIENRI